MSVKKKNLDVYLEEVFKQFIAIKDDDFSKAQEVFKSVFEQIKQKMSEQCNYFKKYSNQVMYGGSVYDGTKATKMDEFDMDIVIRLPINYDDIIIEYDQPGFVRLKIINAFDNLDKQKEWEQCHKVTREWRDAEKYFLQNKFRQWMHGIVQKALNEMDGRATVNGTTYLIKYKESGPAYTLHVRNEKNDEEFKLDVDLVPVIRFMHPRWPKGYRTIEKCQARDWLVVPKPNKELADGAVRNRCWRLSFQEYERELLKECHHLKKVIRLMKKLRTALNMKAIASYYIKTLFLWKVEKENKQYWQNKVSVLFYAMLQEFYDAIKNKNIPYFWNSKNNLIDGLKPSYQKLYAEKLKAVLDSVQANDVDKTIFAMLKPDEIKQFKCSEMYQRYTSIPTAAQTISSRSSSATSSSSSQEQTNSQNSQMDDQTKILLKAIMEKLDVLTKQVELHEERLLKLETACKQSQEDSLNEVKLLDRGGAAQAPSVCCPVAITINGDHVANPNAAPETDSDLILF